MLDSQSEAPVAGVSAREIAKGTGMSLSSVYRAIHELEERGLLLRVPTIRMSDPRVDQREPGERT